MNLPIIMFTILAVALLYCCYTDIRTRHIKNYITFPLIIIGIIFNIILYNLDGLKISFLGILVGFFLGIILYLIGALAYGDVKLFMGVGAFLGYYATIETVVISLFMAIPVAFILSPKAFILSLRNIYLYIKLTVLTKSKQRLVNEGESLASIPYAVCISLGCVGAILSKGEVLSWLI